MQFWRQYDGTAIEGGITPRKPFMAQTWPQHSWRYSDIQGAGGVLTLLNDTLNFYTSGSSGGPYLPHSISLHTYLLHNHS